MDERLVCFQKTCRKFTDSPCGLVPKSTTDKGHRAAYGKFPPSVGVACAPPGGFPTVRLFTKSGDNSGRNDAKPTAQNSFSGNAQNLSNAASSRGGCGGAAPRPRHAGRLMQTEQKSEQRRGWAANPAVDKRQVNEHWKCCRQQKTQ